MVIETLPSTRRIGLKDWPIRYQGYNDTVPFTYRSGLAYEEILETIRTWIPETLLPSLEANFNNVDTALAQTTADLEERVADAIDSFAFVEQNALGFLLLKGPGIDLTGATPSDAAVQAFLDAASDGATVVVPPGSVIAFNTGFTISKRIKFTGGGELRYVGADGGNLIQVSHDGVWLDGIYATNPLFRQKSAVNVSANVFKATHNVLTGWRDGIKIAAEGEWHDIIIQGNHVLDIIGGNVANGESNGDGIVCWGAAVTIVGNRVTCKAGSDARIGIHVEALPDRIVTPFKHSDALATISGNVVTGQFRRSITTEGVQHAVITSNVIADPTCWGINIVGLAHFSIVAHNTIKWTRTAADVQAAFLNTQRSGIYVYCIQETLNSVTIDSNTVHAVAGSAINNGISVAYDSSVATTIARGLRITNNQLVDDSGTMQYGVNIFGSTIAVDISRNRIPSFQKNGIRAFTANDANVCDNRVVGPGAAAGVFGILLDGGASDANISGNRAVNTYTGISAQFRTGTLKLNNNTVVTATNGIDLFSSANAIGTCAINVFSGVGTKLTNMPVGIVTSGANN